MDNLIKEVKQLQAKKTDMINKYGEKCTNPKARLIHGGYKELQKNLFSLVAEGVAIYGESFLKALG